VHCHDEPSDCYTDAGLDLPSISQGTCRPSSGYDGGGAVWLRGENTVGVWSLVAESCFFEDNRSVPSAQASLPSLIGRAVMHHRSCTSLDWLRCSGSAIAVRADTIVLRGCTFRGNAAYGNGGAVSARANTKLDVEGCRFEGLAGGLHHGMRLAKRGPYLLNLFVTSMAVPRTWPVQPILCPAGFALRVSFKRSAAVRFMAHVRNHATQPLSIQCSRPVLWRLWRG